MYETSGINHITIFVENLETSLDFYQKILRMRIVHRGSEYAYLEAGKTWFCISQKNVNSKKEQQIGVHHMALTVSEIDFDQAVSHLRAHDVPIVREPMIRGVGKSINFLDPDGLEWEFHTSDLAERMNVIEEMERNMQNRS